MGGKIKIPTSEFLVKKQGQALKKWAEEDSKPKEKDEFKHKITAPEVYKAARKYHAAKGAIEHQEKFGVMAKDTPEQREYRKKIRPIIDKANKVETEYKKEIKKLKPYDVNKREALLKETQRPILERDIALSKLRQLGKLKEERISEIMKGKSERGMKIGTRTQRKGGTFVKTSQGWKREKGK
jgi:hypothetical protein